MEERNKNLRDTVLTIISEWGDTVHGSKITLEKYDKVLSLISCNIKLSNDNKNFDLSEMRKDKTHVFNYKMKYSTTGNINKDDIKDLNKFYQKHRKIAKLLTGN